MLVRVQILPQKKEIELSNEVAFTTKVISSNENSVGTEWNLDPKGLGSFSAFPQFFSLVLIKKEDVFTLKVEQEISGACLRETFDVE